ncbi:hypothetical protein IFM89_026868 [Coptis chinensis]|uniref:MORF/ORRM1/DAG-like MORF domain-containing protein n=1 Tax=Coptis chinensis TaxID=261450 RepID=A0A835M6S7_9MAGN|nr:hypothetical protein IFM89_026868 [Coptis chinensis]
MTDRSKRSHFGYAILTVFVFVFVPGCSVFGVASLRFFIRVLPLPWTFGGACWLGVLTAAFGARPPWTWVLAAAMDPWRVHGNSLKVELDSLHGQATVLADSCIHFPKATSWLSSKRPECLFSNYIKCIYYCVRLLAEVVGSEDEAKEKIYMVWCAPPFGFAAEIDMETLNKLKVLQDVLALLPDYSVSAKTKNDVFLAAPPNRRKNHPTIFACYDKPEIFGRKTLVPILLGFKFSPKTVRFKMMTDEYFMELSSVLGCNSYFVLAFDSRKTYVEDKEEEMKLLERSVEELESTVDVDTVKGEAERQRLLREELETELQVIRNQMLIVTTSGTSLDVGARDIICRHPVLQSLLEQKDRELQKMEVQIEVLEKNIAEKNAKVWPFCGSFSYITFFLLV